MMECTDSLDEFSKLHTVLCYNLQWFAQDGEGGEKTEPATEKKLKDAREEGKVAKSKELTAAFDLIVLFLVLKIFISFVGGNLIGLFSTVYKKMPDFLKESQEQISSVSVTHYLNNVILQFLLTVLPFFAFGVVITILVSIIQVGFKISTKPMAPKLSKFNPINGFKRILSKDSIFELLKSVLKVGIIMYVAYSSVKSHLLDRVVMIRRQIALELGTVVPIIRLRDNIQLNPNQYIIKIKGIQVTEGEILFDHYMAMNPGYVEEEITGIPTFEPSFHLPAIWITESQRERAESLGYTVVDPPSIIATHLTEVIRSHIAELLTRQDVQNLVNNLKESNPVIVDELIPKLLGLGEIQKVLQNLLSEGISIRDLLTIFETLADHAQTTRDTDVLTEYVRQGLKRAISSKYFPANETTSVITLDPAVEQEIMSSVKQTEQGSYLSLDPDRIKAIIKSVETEIGKLESLGKSAIIITSPIVRMYFKKMTEDYFKDLIVLSYNEVESNVELQSVGMVTA